MKSLMKILGLFISLELIVAPLIPNFSFITNRAFAESCSAGMTFDTTLNRCLTTTQAANVLNATMSCAGGDVECYKTNAQNAFQEKVNAGEAPEKKANNGFVSSVGQAVAIAGPVSVAAFAMKGAKSNCLSPSFWAMVAGAGALVVGDNLANMQHKSRLKKIREDWGKIVNPEEAGGDKDKERETSIEAQSQAFEMLARAEESMEKAANMKKMFFLAATLAYGASTALAVMEIIRGKVDKTALLTSTCKSTPAAPTVFIQEKTESLYSYYSKDSVKPNFLSGQLKYNISHSQDIASLFVNNEAINLTNSSPSIETYEALKSNLKEVEKDSGTLAILKEIAMSMLIHVSPIQTANAEDKAVDTNAAKSFKEDDGKSGNALMAIGAGVGAGLAAGMLAKGMVAEKLTSPVGRAAFSGVMTAWSGIMAKHAAEQAKASKKRAELLRKMKEEFASASGAIYACKSEDRNDPGKPTCYCYTPENQRNSNRSSSQVCQNLWAGKSLNATDYNKLASSTSAKICINNQNQADASCTCKTNNTCMKVSINGISGINPGTMSMLSSSLAPVNGIANGSTDAANLDAAALENQAARMGALNKGLENAKGLEDYKKNKDKDALSITDKLNSAASGMSPNSMLGGSGSSFGMPSSPGQAALALEKELETSGATGIRGTESINANSDSVTNENLEFGLSQDQLKAQETQIAEVMKEKLDYGNNDINPGSTTNIFQVLSNRYQRSGMRRLFDEKGTTQAEKPATTDISK